MDKRVTILTEVHSRYT